MVGPPGVFVDVEGKLVLGAGPVGGRFKQAHALIAVAVEPVAAALGSGPDEGLAPAAEIQPVAAAHEEVFGNGRAVAEILFMKRTVPGADLAMFEVGQMVVRRQPLSLDVSRRKADKDVRRAVVAGDYVDIKIFLWASSVLKMYTLCPIYKVLRCGNQDVT